MKWMVASDIHGVDYYCQKLFAAFAQENPEKLLLLGDLLAPKPADPQAAANAPQSTLSLLNAHQDAILCVRGNCDAEEDQALLEFPMLADSCLFHWADRLLLASHGHRINEARPPQIGPRDLLLNGHSHIPAARHNGSFHYLNPGSVSLPRGGSPHSYLLLTEDCCTIKKLNGEVLLEYRLS